MKIKLSMIALSMFLLSQANATTYNPANFTQSIQSVNTGVLNAQGIASTSAQSTIMRSNVGNFMSNAIKGAIASGVAGTVARALVSGITGTLLTYALIEGTTLLVKTLTANPDGTITFTNSVNIAPNTPAFNQGATGWTWGPSVTLPYTFSTSRDSLAQASFENQKANHPDWNMVSINNCFEDGNAYNCWINRSDTTDLGYANLLQRTVAPMACGAGSYVVGSACVVQPGTTSNQPQTVQPEALGGALPVPDLNAPISAESLADLINRINGQMATNPANMPIPQVTANDVRNYVPSNAMPKVGDITATTTPSGVQTDPNVVPKVDPTNPSNVTNNNSNTTINNTETKVDLGPDPGIGRPNIELETAPTGSQILAPILNMLPSYKNLALSGPGAISCPFGTPFHIDFLNRDYSFSIICTLMNDVGPTIRGAMTAMFGILSIIIILGA